MKPTHDDQPNRQSRTSLKLGAFVVSLCRGAPQGGIVGPVNVEGAP